MHFYNQTYMGISNAVHKTCIDIRLASLVQKKINRKIMSSEHFSYNYSHFFCIKKVLFLNYYFTSDICGIFKSRCQTVIVDRALLSVTYTFCSRGGPS